MNVPRTIRLDLAYDGTAFRGWATQRDPEIRTVEGVLGDALEELLREPVSLSVAGRTDAGVHARGQVASFRTGSTRTPAQIREFLNGRLAPEVSIQHVRAAANGFDARFSASAREYRYRIDTSLDARSVHGSVHVASAEGARPHGDAAGVGGAARNARLHELLPASGCGTIDTGAICNGSRSGAMGILSSVGLRANAFLHQMVRILVGTLVDVGQGRLTASDVRRILAARDRSRAPKAAPARGLTLERVVYGRRG